MLQVPRKINEDVQGWEDVATVEVPATTRRVTAIRKAVEAWGAPIPAEGLEVRLIPAQDAKALTVRPKPPEAPQLEIS